MMLLRGDQGRLQAPIEREAGLPLMQIRNHSHFFLVDEMGLQVVESYRYCCRIIDISHYLPVAVVGHEAGIFLSHCIID